MPDEADPALNSAPSADSQASVPDIVNPATFVAPDVAKDFYPRVTIEFCDRVGPSLLLQSTKNNNWGRLKFTVSLVRKCIS